MPKAKRQVWKRGSVVRIPLDEETYSYAQMLDSPEYAFFDLQDSGDANPEAATRHRVIFRLWVMRHAHVSGRWIKIGDAPLQKGLEETVPRFNQDSISGQVRLGDHGAGRLVTLEECEGYERAAVWDASHVEDRLRDHFAGTPNKWVESMRPQQPRELGAGAAQPAVQQTGLRPAAEPRPAP